MASRLSRKTNETQAPPNETPIYREFQTRIREEDLTEEQLSVREKELKILSEKVSALYYKDARLKASNKQCAIYEEFGLCLTSLTEISRSMLQVKITDRLEALSAEEKEKELKSWTDARKEDALIMMAIIHGDKAVGIKEWEGIGRGSYRDPRYEHYDPHLSKEETLRLIAKKRAALVRFTELICDGLKAWELDESSEFWPANLGSTARKNKFSKLLTTRYQKLIATTIKHIRLDKGVAYCQPGAEPDADLAMRFSLDEQGQPCLPGVWRIRALLPKYLTDQPGIPGKVRSRVSHFELRDFGGASSFLLKHWQGQLPTADSPATLVALSEGSVVKVFPEDEKKYRKLLRIQLRKVDSSGRLTAVRLSRLAFRRIVETSGGDVACAAIATGCNHYLASVRRFYATPSVKYLRSLHGNAFVCILEELATCGWTAPSLPVPELEDSDEAVGSRLCATVPAMREAFRWLRTTIERRLPLSTDADRRQEFVIKHNSYSLVRAYAKWLAE